MTTRYGWRDEKVRCRRKFDMIQQIQVRRLLVNVDLCLRKSE